MKQVIIWDMSRKDLYHPIPGAGTEFNLPTAAPEAMSDALQGHQNTTLPPKQKHGTPSWHC